LSSNEIHGPLLDGVAIIGMSGRFPGARNVSEFWQNQLRGIEAISQFRVEELEVAGATELAKQPNYVRARAILDDVDLFDAEFFGILPREAELMDPQQRLFLECCWEAFEDGGYEPSGYPGAIGVFAGTSVSTYFLSRICTAPGFINEYTGGYQIANYPQMMGNNPDFIATRASYKFNLRGPSFTMQAGCSTSLLAVCQACQSLLTYQSDMALAGGVSITFPQKRGYFYQDGGMGSADGHTRTFDAAAQGTVFGSGVAVVLLKRMEDAARDGDQIYAWIRGFAVNNDGSRKVGYTAPSVEGQANVIAMAHEAAGVDPATIGYVEAHGTGTPLGDPIELSALAKAFGARTSAKGFCAVGTAKTNVGHLDIAAGATGLIHATQIVRSGKLPPTLHFQNPNPAFDLENSPFFINKTLSDWKISGAPRRAGVSAFGVGGTNAHVILEEAPHSASGSSGRSAELLVWSARSTSALEATTRNLAEYLHHQPNVNLADVAYTLKVGRRAFDERRILVARNAEDATAALASRDPRRIFTRTKRSENADICFLFPGQGSQQLNMGRELYETEPAFREEVDRCAELLRPNLGLDLRDVLYPAEDANGHSYDKVTPTFLAQPAIFTTEYALAKLWISWGIEPRYMMGHSVGEFVAACLAGVFTLPDALQLIAARGRMMQDLPPGAMLSVRLSEAEIRPLLSGALSLAAINAPSLCVVAGPFEAVAEFEDHLTRHNVAHRRLHTSHAFHSSMMDPILEPFTAEVRKICLSAPRLPYISGVTGNWITEQEATNPLYWARHFRETVNFSRGITELRAKENCVLLEVGPGNVLATLARQHNTTVGDQIVVSTLTDGTQEISEGVAIQQALGWLWLGGVPLDWNKLHANEKRHRVSLPTYPFERKRFWLEAPRQFNDSGGQLTSSIPHVSTVPQMPETSTSSSAQVFLKQETTMPQPIASTHTLRKDKVRGILIKIFEDLSGMDVSQADSSATFLDMGFDSLFLTQVTQALQSKFSLKITFRQLLGDLATLDALANYVDERLPAGTFDEPVEAAAPSVVAPVQSSAVAFASAPIQAISNTAFTNSVGSPAGPGTIDQLMRDQLQAMNQLFTQQLAVFQASGTIHAAAPGPAPAAIPTATSAPAAQVEGVTVKELKGYTPFKPLEKSVSGKLTSRQQEYISELIERYTKRTAMSKAKTQEYRKVLADPRVVSGFRVQWKEMIYPIITERSKGSHLWDVDGNEYVDILNGFGPIMLGHRPGYVEEAIEKQLHEGFEIGPQTLLAGEVAKMLCEMTGNERATFCNTGSEAVIAAMRVARTVTGRNKVVFFAGDYHGMFDEVLVKGFKKDGEPHSIPIAPGIPRENAANVVVLEYGSEESLEWIRKNAKNLAAVMVEPVQSRHPNLQPVGFLKELRKTTEASDTCLIFDEVVTGFRAHPGGCQALFDIRADLATYGKVLAGGMPIGVLAGKAKYMDALDGGMWQFGDDSYPEVGVTFFAGTFVRHPLAMAACQAVLKHLKEQGPALQQGLSERAADLVNRLNALLETNQVPTRIENFASIFYFSFPSDFRFGSLFYYSLREKGIHLLEGFPCFLTTEHSEADIDRIVHAFEETIAEMQAGGILPETLDKVALREPAEQSVLVPVIASTPLTEPQREIFLAAKFGDDASCSFNESFSLNLRGPLQVDALRDSLNVVIARHEALRATIDPEGMTLHFLPELKLEIPLRDLSKLDDQSSEAKLKQLLAEDARTAFDLTKGPLIRSEIVRLESDHHILLITSHHIICDGWSTNVLLDELTQIYSASVQGRSAKLPVPLRFSEYARSQSAHRDSAEGTEVESYWLAQFKDVPALLDLPLDRPRPLLKGYSGATYRMHIDAEAYGKIKKLGSKKGCTLFATLLAGFQSLLHRLTNQDDIVIGIPAAGQSLLQDGNLVGHCVNFLPLRTKFREGVSFAALLGEVKQTLLDAYDHQSYTYGTLVRKLAIRRDLSRLPLMEVQFNLERIGVGENFHGLKASVDPNPKANVNFDVFFNVVESDQGLMIDCDYNTGLFDQSTIARWLTHFQNLLLAAVANSDQAVDNLSLMTPTEVEALVASWNPRPSDYPVTATLGELFERQATRRPDAVAVTIGAENLTYGELNARANQLARTLRKNGVNPDCLVAVCFERSLEMIVSFLAVLKAGGAYLPIDSSYPKERLQMMLEDAKPAVLLTQERVLASLPKQNAHVICVDRDWPTVDSEANGNLEPTARPENLAYVIYTSGSTGKPKGVMVTQANVARLLSATESWFRFKEQDVWTMFHSYAFDFSVWEIWGSLLTGGRLVIVPYWVTRSPQDFYNLLAQENVTVLNQTPAAFYQVIQVEESEYMKPLSLRCVIFGGEALNFTNLRPWLKRHGHQKPQLVNMYGITETTVHVTYRVVTDTDAEGECRSLIGVPIPDLRLYFLDSKQRPVPPGVVGEMYVGGVGVARGYLNRPDLTSERFLPDPFVRTAGARMYKSGDLARYLTSGDVEYLGRGDTQVKIHGFRIELGEIESALAQHPGVRQTAVVARKDGPRERNLVAYFVAAPGASPAGTELREFIQAKLPAHMIPHAYVRMDVLPLTVNGKIDHTKLPAPDLCATAQAREYVAPSSPQEQALADILKEVLRLERVGITDNLFELGADSLHVFQITSRAAKAGLAVTPRLLLQQRTVAGVLAAMGDMPTSIRPPAPKITPVAREKYRLTREASR